MIDQLPTHVHWENYDFNIVREDWNKYQLEDETILKIRIILNKVWVGEKQSEGNIPFTFNFDTKTMPQRYPFDLEENPPRLPYQRKIWPPQTKKSFALIQYGKNGMNIY